MRKNHAENQSGYQVRYIQMPQHPEIYAVFYRKEHTLCLNSCFSGDSKLIIVQQEK
ncbi:MAG: hypothetical protein MR966_05255 [Lachnospiraceae bacterium]|nr:hypothetical protein [Lachnospiraceae bacterium]